MKKHLSIISLVLLILFGTAACRKAEWSQPDYALQVSYEMESQVTRKYDEQAEGYTQEMQGIMEIPTVERRKISINIGFDGTSEWCIEMLTPKNKIELPHEQRPNTSPSVKTIKMRNGMYYAYDQHGALFESQAMDIPNFKDLVDLLVKEKDPRLVNTLLTQKSVPAGSQITTLDEQTSLVTAPVEGQPGYSVRMIVDHENNLVIASHLYQDSKLLQKSFFSYKDNDGGYLLNSSLEKTFGEDSEGYTYLSEKITQYENMKIVDNTRYAQ